MKKDNKKEYTIAAHRADFRRRLDKMGATKGSFAKAQYKKWINSHWEGLKKYSSQLNYYIERYLRARDVPFWKKWLVHRIFATAGKKKLPLIYAVHECARRCPWLRNEFLDYVIDKTHFSYGYIKPVPKARRMFASKEKYAEYVGRNNSEGKNDHKFAEFIYLILAEYTILHNFMWSSKMRPKEVKTIDKWMKAIK